MKGRRKTSSSSAPSATERPQRKVRAKAVSGDGSTTASPDKVKGMATKNCPQCSKQVPVACKKCGCGHVFFATRRSATSTSVTRENSEDGDDVPMSPTESLQSESNKPTRRSGRVTRERPNFYDALQYENQTRRQKQLIRQSKQGKSEDQDEGSDEPDLGKPQSTRTQLSHDHNKSGKDPKAVGGGVGGEPKPKKRRGRPPGITGSRSKPNQGYKMTSSSVPSGKTRKASGNGSGNGNENPDSPNSDIAHEIEDKAIIASITPEKALQYHIVLQDINSKICRVSWRAQE